MGAEGIVSMKYFVQLQSQARLLMVAKQLFVELSDSRLGVGVQAILSTSSWTLESCEEIQELELQ